MSTRRKYKSNKTIDDTNPQSKKDIIKFESHLGMYRIPQTNKYVQLRLVSPVFSEAVHWIDIKTKAGKKIGIPKACSRYNGETDSFDSSKSCVYCDMFTEYPARQRYYVNAIIRDIQEDEPSRFKKKYSSTEAKTGFKDGLDSKAWTPVRVLSLPPGVTNKIKGLSDLNKHKVNGKTRSMPVSDEEFGMDIGIKFDPNVSSSQAYDVQRGDKSPLSEDEIDYLHWDIEKVIEMAYNANKEDTATQKKEAKQLAKNVIVKNKENDNNPDKKSSSKKKSKKEESSEEESEESSEMEMSEDSDDKSSKKKSSKKKSKKEESSEESSEEKSEESSELEMSEDSEESEDKSSKKKSSKKSKKEESSEESEESSELEMSEESEEESEDSDDKSSKKKSSSKKSKKEESSDEESEESSELELSEESEESSEEKPRKSKSRRSKSKRR